MTKMTNERAAQILDPNHRETYESIEPVNEACRIGRDAILRRVPQSPHPDGDEYILACPSCGSGEYLHNEDGCEMPFCGQCGQAIDWGKTAIPVLDIAPCIYKRTCGHEYCNLDGCPEYAPRKQKVRKTNGKNRNR